MLNATAELNALGQLVLLGTGGDDVASLQVDANGELLFRDGVGEVIPIENHPDGPDGSTNPLDPAAVTSGQVLFETGAGDDVLDLQLPSGLDVTVAPSEGNDSANLLFPASSADNSDIVEIDSEQITFDRFATSFDLRNDQYTLRGDVFLGTSGTRTDLSVTLGDFAVEGRWVLSGDVLVIGPATVDLSAAVITANTVNTNLQLALLQDPTSDLVIGGADASGGHLVSNLQLLSARTATFAGGPVTIADDLVVRNVSEAVQFDAPVRAETVSVITPGAITGNAGIDATGGGITLVSSDVLAINDDLRATSGNQFGTINLSGNTVELSGVNVTTAGAMINVSGPVTISGEVIIDSGDLRRASIAGDVRFFDPISGEGAGVDTLRIDARGGVADGLVRLQGAIGRTTSSPLATDLNMLAVDAGQIETESIGVSDGNIRLSAAEIRLTGDELRTRVSGDVIIDGQLLLPMGDTTVSAAGAARFESTIRGQAGTTDVRITAGTEATLNGMVSTLRDLSVESDRVRLSADIDTTFAVDGDINLVGMSSVIIDNDSFVQVGDATITINGGGGLVDVGQSMLASSAAANAITLRNASSIVIGDVVALQGQVTIGINHDVLGPISQSSGSTLEIDRLITSSGGAVALGNRGNAIAELTSVVTLDGAITIDSETTMAAIDVVSRNLNGIDDADGSNTGPDSRDVRLSVHGLQSDLLVTSVKAQRDADVVLNSDDDILDSDLLDGARVEADDLRLAAGNQTLDQQNAVELATDVNELVGRVEGTLRGDVVIDEVDRIHLASSDRLDVSDRIVTANGAVLVTSRGTIEVASRAGGEAAIDAGGGHEVDLAASGDASDILVDRAIQSDNGRIQLVADRNVRLTADGDVFSGGGDVVVQADAMSAGDAGSIFMDDGALIDASSGRIELAADQDIVLGGLRSTNDTDDAIRITTQSASLVDGGDQHLDIEANLGLVTVRAVSGIGDGDSLETRVARIDSEVTATGETNLDEQDAIVLESVVTQDGSITIRSGQFNPTSEMLSGPEPGTITALRVLSRGTVDQDILLVAAGDASDIEVRSIVAAGQTDVELRAGDDIVNLAGAEPLVADDLALSSSNLSGDGETAIGLATDVNDLRARVTGEVRGDIVIDERNTINLASSDFQQDEIIETGNGQIEITAEQITVVDNSDGDDGNDLKQDPEIVARGANHGRIELVAAGQLHLDDEVQLHAGKRRADGLYFVPETRPGSALPGDGPLAEEPVLAVEDRSIYLKADSVLLGERIELNTGEAQGVARIFSPRPEVLPRVIDPVTGDPAQPMPRTDGILPALFDPFSVRTNILEQAVVNDATGILTLDIGQAGERGLTVDIDWGAPEVDDEFGRPRRFQQLNGLSADEAITFGLGGSEGLDPEFQGTTADAEPRLRVEHFYSQANIVDSRLNGREASTKPLEVRFAVRHHESILVEASSVQQGPDFELDADFGGIVSSSDNPATSRDELPGLENGEALFLIPSLSIPVAFFPVRDVIPEIEETEFVVREESAVTLSQSSFETVESTSVPVTGREEFFQIRVLSPDPEGDDLAAPEKLPDDILDGDKIQRLFEKLPDGRYQIEYVLGDTTRRSVLRVDVRGGEATIPDDGLDEGVLELIPLDVIEMFEKRDDGGTDQSQDPGGLDQPLETDAPPASPPEGDSARLDEHAPDRASSFPPLASGLVAASALRRRWRRSGTGRFSASARFARRRSDAR